MKGKKKKAVRKKSEVITHIIVEKDCFETSVHYVRKNESITDAISDFNINEIKVFRVDCELKINRVTSFEVEDVEAI